MSGHSKQVRYQVEKVTPFFDDFQKISEDSLTFVQKPDNRSKHFLKIPEDCLSFLKITKDFWERSKDVSIIEEYI